MWKALLRTMRPRQWTKNAFLFAAFLTKTMSFLFLAGALSYDIMTFVGYIGLSISLNGGICRPARQPAATTAEPPKRELTRPRLSPAFQRQ